jgi:hypothetical protein
MVLLLLKIGFNADLNPEENWKGKRGCFRGISNWLGADKRMLLSRYLPKNDVHLCMRIKFPMIGEKEILETFKHDKICQLL